MTDSNDTPTLHNVLNRIDAMKDDMSAKMDVFGGMLHCDQCGKERTMQEGDAGYYLFNGWPKCCGYTMRWITANEIEQGRAALAQNAAAKEAQS